MTNESYQDKKIAIKSSPGFIREISPRIFHEAKFYRYKKGKIIIYSQEENPLEEDLDIREVATRNLSVLVKSNQTECFNDVIETLRNWAILSGFDYYSYHNISGDNCLNNINFNRSIYYSEVIPRFFRKIR